MATPHERIGMSRTQVDRNQDLEIVLVGADSLDTIRKTHGHYFTKAGAVTLPELAAS
jgi:hypothetical protein